MTTRFTSPYGFPFEQAPSGTVPGHTFHGGPEDDMPILAEHVNDELERVETDHNARIEALENDPTPGWRVLAAGSASASAGVNLTNVGGFTHYRLFLRGALDIVGTDPAWVIMQFNPGDPTTTNQGAVAIHTVDNTIEDAVHSATAETFRIARWSNAVGCNAVIDIFNTVPDGPNLISHISRGTRISANPNLNTISHSSGRINETRTLETIRFSRLSPSSAFGSVHWKLMGARQ